VHRGLDPCPLIRDGHCRPPARDPASARLLSHGSAVHASSRERARSPNPRSGLSPHPPSCQGRHHRSSHHARLPPQATTQLRLMRLRQAGFIERTTLPPLARGGAPLVFRLSRRGRARLGYAPLTRPEAGMQLRHISMSSTPCAPSLVAIHALPTAIRWPPGARRR